MSNRSLGALQSSTCIVAFRLGANKYRRAPLVVIAADCRTSTPFVESKDQSSSEGGNYQREYCISLTAPHIDDSPIPAGVFEVADGLRQGVATDERYAVFAIYRAACCAFVLSRAFANKIIDLIVTKDGARYSVVVPGSGANVLHQLVTDDGAFVTMLGKVSKKSQGRVRLIYRVIPTLRSFTVNEPVPGKILTAVENGGRKTNGVLLVRDQREKIAVFNLTDSNTYAAVGMVGAQDCTDNYLYGDTGNVKQHSEDNLLALENDLRTQFWAASRAGNKELDKGEPNPTVNEMRCLYVAFEGGKAVIGKHSLDKKKVGKVEQFSPDKRNGRFPMHYLASGHGEPLALWFLEKTKRQRRKLRIEEIDGYLGRLFEYVASKDSAASVSTNFSRVIIDQPTPETRENQKMLYRYKPL